jgi:hypothetical protein
MKLLALVLMSISINAFAIIPTGNYKIEKIQCKTGKVMKLGGKFMVYDILLNVGETQMEMTATAKSAEWAPFKMDCKQLNRGKFVYTKEGKYEGDLPNVMVKCNAPAWTSIMKKKLFGVEKYGEFTYTVSGSKLVVFNPETMTKYSCKASGDYPIYHYTKL